MAFYQLNDVFGYQDANKIKKLWADSSAPSSPEEGEIWLDISGTPSNLKRYNGTSWDIIGEISASDILDSIKTVGGSGSGLDADKLDGLEGSQFVQTSGTQSVAGEKTFSDSITLDGDVTVRSALTGSAGAHADHPSLRIRQTADASYNIGDVHGELEFYTDDSGGPFPGAQAFVRAVTTRADGINYADTGLSFGVSTSSIAASEKMLLDGNGDLTVQGNTVWHAGNDGSGSTLDADKLDGQEGSYYTNAGNLNAGTVPSDRLALWKNNTDGETGGFYVQCGLRYQFGPYTSPHSFTDAYTSSVVVVATAEDWAKFCGVIAITTTSFQIRHETEYDFARWIAVGKK